MRRFFRFSIRDLFWLTLVVAVGLGWVIREQKLRKMEARMHLVEQRLDDVFGLKVDWEEGHPIFQPD